MRIKFRRQTAEEKFAGHERHTFSRAGSVHVRLTRHERRAVADAVRRELADDCPQRPCSRHAVGPHRLRAVGQSVTEEARSHGEGSRKAHLRRQRSRSRKGDAHAVSRSLVCVRAPECAAEGPGRHQGAVSRRGLTCTMLWSLQIVTQDRVVEVMVDKVVERFVEVSVCALQHVYPYLHMHMCTQIGRQTSAPSMQCICGFVVVAIYKAAYALRICTP